MSPIALLKFLFKVLGLEIVEWAIHSIGLVVLIVLTVLKSQAILNGSWWIVFSPSLAASALCFYFQLLVFFRLREDGFKEMAWKRSAWTVPFLSLLALFECLLPLHLEGGSASVTQAISPLIVMAGVAAIRVCLKING